MWNMSKPPSFMPRKYGVPFSAVNCNQQLHTKSFQY